MSGTGDYYMWATEKYGFDENGDPVVDTFDLVWEFFSDHLDQTIELRGHSLKYDAFLSYTWVDRDEPESLVRILTREGMRVWFDRNVIGETDQPFLVYRALHEGIAQSRCGIAYVTPKFMEREWTVHEVRGMARHGRLKALVLDGLDADVRRHLLSITDREVPSISRIGATLDEVAESIIKLVRPESGFDEASHPARR
jgi:hypothetical protein